jgi:transposase InsO family protein
VSDHQADYPIATMCRVLGVSSSGYHAWVKRRPSQRAETDAVLIAAIRAAHTASRGTYGAPRVHAELAAKGIRVGCKRVARLMTQAGLAGVCRRRFVTTTVKDGSRQAPDLVERNFTAEARLRSTSCSAQSSVSPPRRFCPTTPTATSRRSTARPICSAEPPRDSFGRRSSSLLEADRLELNLDYCAIAETSLARAD